MAVVPSQLRERDQDDGGTAGGHSFRPRDAEAEKAANKSAPELLVMYGSQGLA